MKKGISLLFLLIVSLSAIAQVKFEKGYFIDNDEVKHECLIYNKDWRKNPAAFEYKDRVEGDIKSIDINSVKEFGIYNFSKYVRAEVNIDRSKEEFVDLTYNKNPEWSKETVFLEVIVEGKASLYVFKDKDNIRYFYKTPSTAIEQLVYKKYKVASKEPNNEDFSINENKHFQQQLKVNVSAENTNPNVLNNLTLTKNTLKKYFVKYNKEVEVDFTDYIAIKDRDVFKMNIKAGVNRTSFAADFPAITQEIKSDKSYEGRFGLEFEFIFPFNKNKLSFSFEPTYQYYREEIPFVSNQNNRYVFNISYSYIEIPLGLKYRILNRKNTELFIRGTYNLHKQVEGSIELPAPFGWLPHEMSLRPTLSAGLGYRYKAFGIEFRASSPQELIQTPSTTSNYSKQAVILSYRLINR